MAILKTLWGLLVDDNLLVAVLLLGLGGAWLLSALKMPTIAPLGIVLGLLVGLGASIRRGKTYFDLETAS